MSVVYGAIAGLLAAGIILQVLFPKESSHAALVLGGCLGGVFFSGSELLLIRDQTFLFLLKILIPIALFEIGVVLFSGKSSNFLIRAFRPLLIVFSIMLFGWV